MKKLLILVPVFLAAACIDIKIEVNKTANAGDGLGANGSVNGTRLTRQYLNGSDGSKMETPQWLDNELNLLCEYKKLEDGSTRCVPEYIRANMYSDASCTKPVYVEAYTKNSFPCHTFQSYVRFGHDYASGCGNVDIGMTMYKVDKLITKGAAVEWYELDSAKACIKKGVSSAPGIEAAMFEVIEIGDETRFVDAVQQ